MDIENAGIHSGSSFDEFLEEEGIREEAEAAAHDRVLAVLKETARNLDGAVPPDCDFLHGNWETIQIEGPVANHRT